MTPSSPQRPTTTALVERVKELTCLLQMARIAGKPGISIDEILERTVALLIPAWQYPESTSARIVLDDDVYAADNFRTSSYTQRTDVMVRGVRRGFVEVVFLEEAPSLDEDPFLGEEQNMLDAVGQQLGLVIERKESERERAELENQLRHADRLATIGLLAAGVAHELNEPLGNILGFAQLARKCPGLPDSARGDLEKIERASLNARETIKKLLMFARQKPPEKLMVDVNQVVRETLALLEPRCVTAGIGVECMLEPDLPRVPADPSQLNQVIVNLVVNAIQAMPHGGTIWLRTETNEGYVRLSVEDSGSGMNSDELDQAFVPFYTTKDVGQGTGLGLPVVHGIITAHEGCIRLHSIVGKGTQVEIHLPLAPSQTSEDTPEA